MVEAMRRQRLRLTLMLLCAAAAGVCAVPAADAQATFSGTVCSMLSSSQVAALHAPSACTARTLKGAGNTTAYGLWQPTTVGGAHLSITVVTWANAKKLSSAEKTIKALPGTVKTIKGIGSVAYESSLGNQIVVNFVKGKSVVNMQLQSPTSIAGAGAFNAAAKSIAGKL
jgi:hypothetical protein